MKLIKIGEGSNIEASFKTKITFLGTSGATPENGNDTASFVINDKYLVDTGWNAVMNLISVGINPREIEYVIFTHFHHDHYMSLPALLYFLISGKSPNLKIIGPAEELEHIVTLSLEFLQRKRYFEGSKIPELIPLRSGECYETSEFRLDACEALHPVPALCYRYQDKLNERFFSFTGDTAYYPPIIEHVRNSSLLIHEASLGPTEANPGNNDYLHSGSVDAARVADQAGVEKLLLVHGSLMKASESVEAAKKHFSGEVEWPRTGQIYYV